MISFESKHLEVILHQGTSDFLLVTFATKNEVADGRTFWAQEIARRCNITTIGVMPKGPNWYPAADMARAIAAIATRLSPYSRIVVYGQSMGAYAAIKYSRALGATHVLAFSPQCSIDPADVGAFDRRFSSSFQKDLHRGMAIQPDDVGGDVYVFYDPYDREDGLNVEQIVRTAPTVREIRVPWTAHFPIVLFRGTQAATGLIQACLDDDEPAIRRAAAERRRAASVRVATACTAYARRNVRTARRLYERRSVFFPQKDIAGFYSKLGQCALDQGDLDEAESALCLSLILEPGNTHNLRLMSIVHSRRNRLRDAVEWARRAVLANPADPNLLNHLGGYLLAVDNLSDAEEVFRSALKLNPRNADVMRRMSGLCARQQNEAGAVAWAEKAAETAPNNVGTQVHLSGTLLRYGHVHKAFVAARKAVELAPTDPVALERLRNAEARLALLTA